MKNKILIALVFLVGFPSVALGGSFTVSLIQGKTPAEAVQILAGQIDTLLGRVERLETQQTATTESIDATQLEIERLKLENENLRLEAQKTARQSEKNETAIKAVPACERLYKVLTCARGVRDNSNAKLNMPSISSSASIEEVLLALNNKRYHVKPGTDVICFTNGDNVEGACRARIEYIQNINSDRASARSNAERWLSETNTTIQTNQPEFDRLNCEAVLEEYSPNLPPPGCG